VIISFSGVKIGKSSINGDATIFSTSSSYNISGSGIKYQTSTGLGFYTYVTLGYNVNSVSKADSFISRISTF
jgi:hypothetical protein